MCAAVQIRFCSRNTALRVQALASASHGSALARAVKLAGRLNTMNTAGIVAARRGFSWTFQAGLKTRGLSRPG